jgi:hypothetical protein
VQIHWLIGTQHLTRSNTERKRITNLTGCAGDRDIHGTFHEK